MRKGRIDYAFMGGVSQRVGERADGAYGGERDMEWLGVDWREHQRWVRVQDRPVNLIELGEGPPLVFVHGLMGSWPNWLCQLPAFAREHRVIAMDLPGFGHSPMGANAISIDSYASMLDELMGTLGLEGADVVGNSMGGQIAAQLAIAFPGRIHRLVLVSAAGISTTAMATRARLAGPIDLVENVVASRGRWVAANAEHIARRAGGRRATLMLVARHPERLPPAIAAELLRGAGRPGFAQGFRAVLGHDLREGLAEVRCPTLIVWGSDDRLIPVRDAWEFERRIAGAEAIVFQDTGHIAMVERPDAFNRTLSEFLH
jgi:pimeloyl-ACP methyl ester carboxylesterase